MSEIPYRIVHSSRKSLAIEVREDLSVVLRCPNGVADSTAIRFADARADWIERQKEKFKNRVDPRRGLESAEIEALRRRAETYIPQRVDWFADQMGVQPAGVRITAARRRFGSCSAKNALCFSLYLMCYPSAAIDYVVVHELAHILHKDHGPDFYALVARHLPDYKERIRMLKGM
ncbi:MAG: M48 family metallopeptidase [Candidatus Howiella sp.]|jgi:predicted metal-dependent hydrolase